MKAATARLAALALCLVASPATAQVGGQSDVTGPPTTGSDIAGGVFTPDPVRRAATAPMPAAAATLAAAARLGSGGMSVPGAGPVAPPVQRAMLHLLLGRAAPDEIRQLADGLRGCGCGRDAERLVHALEGVAAAPTAARLVGAVRAYNRLVLRSSPDFLAHPTPELLAIRSVLEQMLLAAS